VCRTSDGIHKSTISLRFLRIILRFLRLEVSTFAFVFLQYASLIDWFYSSYRFYGNYVFIYMYKQRVIIEKTMLLSKVNKEIM
jgi:hypothetical protein